MTWINLLLVFLGLLAMMVLGAEGNIDDAALEDCLRALLQADGGDEGGEPDGRIQGDEFIAIVRLLGPEGFLEDAEVFGDLPLGLQAAFNTLACSCSNMGGSPMCCIGDDANLNITGADTKLKDTSSPIGSDEGDDEGSSSPQEGEFLIRICEVSIASIEVAAASSTVSSGGPSQEPSAIPTGATRSSQPSPIPTGVSTTTPSFQPAKSSISVKTSYQIALRDGLVTTPDPNYVSDLEAAVDGLVQDLAACEAIEALFLPSTVSNLINISCPKGRDNDDLCQNVTHDVNFVIETHEDDNELACIEALRVAIADESLFGAALSEVAGLNPGFELLVVEESTGPPSLSPVPILASSSESLSAAAIGGIAATGAFLLLFTGLLVSRKRRATEFKARGENDGSWLQALHADSEEEVNVAVAAAAARSRGLQDGSGRRGSNGDSIPEALTGSSHLSSSPSGSGLSSSAGVGSFRTSSFDTNESSSPSRSPRTGNSPPDVQRQDLDTLLDTDDWGSVEDADPLLAAAMAAGIDLSPASVDREDELSALVGAGDWEGVVLAATRMEAEAEAEDAISRSSDPSSYSSSKEASSISQSTSLGESPTEVERRMEIRSEVEALVQRLMPEERDNVDSMMLQFKGREEDLVDTLQAMEQRQGSPDRDVVRVAMVAAQRRVGSSSSSQVRRSTSSNAAVMQQQQQAPRVFGVPGDPGIAALISSSSSEGDGSISQPRELEVFFDDLDPDSASTAANQGLGTWRPTELETAIEEGDWEAVGEAATMAGEDVSITQISQTKEETKEEETKSSSGSK